MNRSTFDKFGYGFLFILIDFKIMGFDILPDIIGYILFALGFKALVSYSNYFNKGFYVSIPMIIISLFSVYEKQVQTNGINFGVLGALGVLAIPIAIATIVLSILVVYYLFKGITEMANNKGEFSIAGESENKWRQFIYLQLAYLAAIIFVFIPLLGIFYIIGILVISIIYTYYVMKFTRTCGEYL